MIPNDVVGLLRNRGHAVASSRDLGLDNFGDDILLLAAARTARVLLTHDIKDFEKPHDAWRRWPAARGRSRKPCRHPNRCPRMAARTDGRGG